jgi:hypothetical protein
MCAHKLQTGRHGTQLFPGRTPADPFYPSTIRLRAPKAWGWKLVPNPEPGPPQQIWIKCRGDALQPLTPHEARHCGAGCMIAAGMDWKKITEFIGHSDVRTTYNRYGKVVPEDLATRCGPARGVLRPGPGEASTSPSGPERDWCWQRDGGEAAHTAPAGDRLRNRFSSLCSGVAGQLPARVGEGAKIEAGDRGVCLEVRGARDRSGAGRSAGRRALPRGSPCS